MFDLLQFNVERHGLGHPAAGAPQIRTREENQVHVNLNIHNSYWFLKRRREISNYKALGLKDGNVSFSVIVSYRLKRKNMPLEGDVRQNQSTWTYTCKKWQKPAHMKKKNPKILSEHFWDAQYKNYFAFSFYNPSWNIFKNIIKFFSKLLGPGKNGAWNLKAWRKENFGFKIF